MLVSLDDETEDHPTEGATAMSPKQSPPDAILHPPWRRLAETFLKDKDPATYRSLSPRQFEAYLDEQVERARETYESTYLALKAKHPGKEAWCLQAAQELTIRDVLDPTA